MDQEFAALAEQVPGFGGLYYDRDSKATIVHLADLDRAFEARQVIGEYLAERRRFTGELIFVQGQYDFSDLADWRRQITLFGRGFLTMTDIDEVANRLLIGVKDDASLSILREALPGLGIPGGAAVIRVIPYVVEEDIRGYLRPVVGGLRVLAKPGTAYCSLGFVAIRLYPHQVYDLDGPRYAVTASHCTSNFGIDDNDVLGQPTQTEAIGVEYSDPPLHSSSEDPACPTPDPVCRRSDAALFLLENNSDTLSTFEGVATVNNLIVTGTAFYTGKQAGFNVDQPVTKVGEKTGQSSGLITNTCVEPFTFDGRIMVCQFYANYNSGDGDSGAPVWYTDAAGDRWIAGVHWGRNTFLNVAIFSMWMYATSEIANDILARTGEQWNPSFSDGPDNFSTQ